MKNGHHSEQLERAAADLFADGPIRDIGIGMDIPTNIDQVSRQELMNLAKKLRTMADAIDVITKVKRKKALDEAGEPTFRFAARVSLPDDFRMTKNMADYAASAGFSEKEAKQMLETFVTFYRKGGKKWQDWTRVWMDWVRREKERAATAPKQRISSGQLNRW